MMIVEGRNDTEVQELVAQQLLEKQRNRNAPALNSVRQQYSNSDRSGERGFDCQSKSWRR
jgi:hypothetical protein